MSTWKRNAPCNAKIVLTNMFKNNEITPDATHAFIKNFNGEFKQFSLAVFRGSFNETHLKYETEYLSSFVL